MSTQSRGHATLTRYKNAMSTINIMFLAGFMAALIAMLAFSARIRAIAWESIRHPFTASVVVERDGKVEVTHGR
jgi:hypothetical protein